MNNLSSKRTHNKRSTAQKLFLITAVSVGVLVIAAGSLYALEKSRITDLVKDPFYVSEQEKAEEATKNDPTTGDKGDTNVVDGVDGNKNPNDIPESTSMSITLNSSVQNSGIVKSSVSIANNAQEGVCSFTFSKDNARPVARSITTSNDSCEVSIPEQEFEMTGTWNLSVHYYANDTQASTTGTVIIQ